MANFVTGKLRFLDENLKLVTLVTLTFGNNHSWHPCTNKPLR